MKLLGLLTAAFAAFLFAVTPSFAQGATVNLENLPDTGTYYIVNAHTKQALQPAGASVGQNVLLYDFSRSGLQKWYVTRHIDPVTQLPTNRYSIRLAGEAELILQPHPMAGLCAIIGSDKSTYIFDPIVDAIIVKSAALNGDAMYPYAEPPMNSETKFGPNDGSRKFQWKFLRTD